MGMVGVGIKQDIIELTRADSFLESGKSSRPVGRACNLNGHQQMGQNNRMDTKGQKENKRKTKLQMEILHQTKGGKQLNASGTKSSRVEVYVEAIWQQWRDRLREEEEEEREEDS